MNKLLHRLADRLPPWMGSIRIRLTLLYSLLLFGLAAVVVAGIYIGLSRSLDDEPVSRRQEFLQITDTGQGPPRLDVVSRDVPDALATFEQAVNKRTIEKLRTYSFSALGLLFIGSLGVGWYVAGLVLRPIGRITSVARDIQATDLSRRIDLQGPNDELRRLADTFDAMLSRLDDAFASQQQFIHEASHELRNPIAVIRTNADVTLSDPHASPDDIRESAAVVQRSAERMSTLVDDLLVYARHETPTQREGLVDLRDVIIEAGEEFAAAATAKDVELVAVGEPGAWAHGDSSAMRRAVANLVANAVRMSPPGTRIRLASGVEGAWVWAAVEDHGPGIPEIDQPHVWDRFWRGDGNAARAAGRSGLGLTIVRRIAEDHNGTVALHSEVGRGSTFVIWLPKATLADEHGIELPTVPPQGFPAPSLDGPTELDELDRETHDDDMAHQPRRLPALVRRSVTWRQSDRRTEQA